MLFLRYSTASQEILLGIFVDSTDGNTEETALTIANTDIKIWKEGATTEASKNSGGATHIANGRYYAVLDATDTGTLGKLEINVHVAGALAVRREFMVLPAVVYDAMVLGTDNLDVSAVQLAGQTITAAAGVTFPASVASPTNITAGTITTTTNLTNLPAITAGWLTAAGIAASALNGKGDWNVGKTGYSLTQAFPSNFSSLAITVGGAATVGTNNDKTGYSLASGSIQNSTFAADTGLVTVRSNTAQAGAATSITLDASASSVTDFYINDLIIITGGTGAVQGKYITAYNGTTKVATVSAWKVNPDATSTFAIIAADSIPGATAPTATQVADAVWDEVLSGHLTAGSTGAALNASGSAGDPWSTALPGVYGAGTAGYIMGTVNTKIGYLPSATAGAVGGVFIAGSNAATTVNFTGNLSGSVGSVTVVSDKTGYSLSSAGIQAIWDALTSALVTVGSIGKRIVDYLTGDSYARLGAPAGASHAADIAAVKTETASIQADTNDIQTRLPAALVGGRMDVSLGAIDSSTTTLAAFKRAVKGNVIGTVGVGSTTTSIVSSALTPAGSVASQFKGKILTFTDDTTTAALRGQSTDITNSTASGTPTFTVSALTTSPVSGDSFSIQ